MIISLLQQILVWCLAVLQLQHQTHHQVLTRCKLSAGKLLWPDAMVIFITQFCAATIWPRLDLRKSRISVKTSPRFLWWRCGSVLKQVIYFDTQSYTSHQCSTSNLHFFFHYNFQLHVRLIDAENCWAALWVHDLQFALSQSWSFSYLSMKI